MARQRTPKEKMSAVLTADRLNSTEAAARETGIPARSIRQWRNDPELAELRRKTREETAEEVTMVEILAWTRLIERLQADQIETRDLIILAGVATDKAQLLSGQPTARTENKSITDGLDDHERQALNDAILGELGRRSDARAPEPAVGAPVEEGAATS